MLEVFFIFTLINIFFVAFLNPFVLNMLEHTTQQLKGGEKEVAFLNPFVLNMLVLLLGIFDINLLIVAFLNPFVLNMLVEI